MGELLAVSERILPEEGGGSLATHLIMKLLSESQDIHVTTLTGTQEPSKLGNVRYLFTPLLKATNRIALWKNISIMSGQRWFLKLLASSDILYVPGYCYPLIGLAKRLGKKVIVHLHGYEPISYSAIVLASDQGRKIPRAAEFEVLEHHGTLKALTGGFFAQANGLIRLWLSRADEIVCVSKKQAEIIAEAAPELASKMRVLYNPLPEIALTKKFSDRPSLLYVGGDSYVKGFHLFLKSSQEILERDRRVRFMLAGSYANSTGSFLGKLNERSNDAYCLLGQVSHEEVMRLNSTSQALLFPSACEEALPYAVLEAMLSGTIPVASRVGAVPEIVQASYAEKTMFTAGNVDEMVDRVGTVLQLSEDQLLDIGAGLREDVLRRFDANRIRNEWLELLR